MASSRIITGVGKAIPGATGVTLLARLRGSAGALLTAESLASIGYTVTDTTLGTTLGTGSLTPNQVVYDSLVTGDYRWQQDSPAAPGPDGASGYNFLAVLPASLFPVRAATVPDLLAGPAQAHQYQADVVFTPLSGQPFRQSWVWMEQVVFG